MIEDRSNEQKNFLFTFEHQESYQKIQFKFFDAVESMDHNNIIVRKLIDLFWNGLFQKFSGSPLLRITDIPEGGGGLKNENLENSRGLCLKFENSRGS